MGTDKAMHKLIYATVNNDAEKIAEARAELEAAQRETAERRIEWMIVGPAAFLILACSGLMILGVVKFIEICARHQ